MHEDEQLMYEHLLMRWDYLRKHPLCTPEEEQKALPILNQYIYGCSICDKHDGVCTDCLLSIVDQCCMSDTSYVFLYVKAYRNEREGIASYYATALFNLIKKLAIDRGFTIKEITND